MRRFCSSFCGRIAFLGPTFVMAACLSARQAYNCTNLGVLPGSNESRAFGINDSGVVVGRCRDLAAGGVPAHPFVFNGTMSDPGVIAGYSLGGLAGINSSGAMVGTADSTTLQSRAERYVGGSIENCGTVSGRSGTIGVAINDSNVVVGYTEDTAQTIRAFRVTNVIEDIGTLPGKTQARATAINAAGQIVGSSWVSSSSSFEPFLYSGGVMTSLTPIAGDATFSPNAINDSGIIAGSMQTPSGGRAAVLANGSLHNLGTLPGGQTSVIRGINNAGDLVGRADDQFGSPHAVLYGNSANQLTDLNALIDPDADGVGHWFRLLEAFDINTGGQIVGYGFYDPDGNGPEGLVTRAFLLTPVPEPSLVGAIFMLTAVVRHRRRTRA